MTELVPQKERYSKVADLLLGKNMQTQLALALPRHITPGRMARVVLTSIQRNPKLLECETKTLLGALMTASSLGLEPDNVSGQAYLLPFRNSRKNITECQLIPGYKGLLALARRSGEISTIIAEVVCEHDDFDWGLGDDPFIKHKPTSFGKRGEVVAYYAAARFKDGGKQFVVMSREECEAHRKRFSKAAQSGPWSTDFDAMAKKTCLRMLCKLLPTSAEMIKADSLDTYAESGQSQGLEDAVKDFDFIDVESSEPEFRESDNAGSSPDAPATTIETIAREIEELVNKHNIDGEAYDEICASVGWIPVGEHSIDDWRGLLKAVKQYTMTEVAVDPPEGAPAELFHEDKSFKDKG